MPSTRPTILLAHGSYHTPAPYSSLLSLLQSHSHKTYCPQLPCADLAQLLPGSDPANPNFDQDPPAPVEQTRDAETLKSLLKKLVDQEGEEILLVAHSSGGWSASEAAVPEFQRAVRKREGKKGGIIGIFYISAFLIPVGQSVWGFFSSQPKDKESEPKLWFTRHRCNLTTVNDAPYFFFHDLPQAEAEKWTKTLTACPFLRTELTNDAYSALPCAYMLCETDRVLPLEYQNRMIEVAEKMSKNVIERHRTKGGHEPFLSYPEEVADAILAFVGRLEGSE